MPNEDPSPGQSPNERRWTIYVCPQCDKFGPVGPTVCIHEGGIERVEVMPVPSSQGGLEEALAAFNAWYEENVDDDHYDFREGIEAALAEGFIRDGEDSASSGALHPSIPSSRGGLEERVQRMAEAIYDSMPEKGIHDKRGWLVAWESVPYQRKRSWLTAARNALAVLADGGDRAVRLEAILRVALEDVPGWEEEAETFLADGAGEGEQDG